MANTWLLIVNTILPYLYTIFDSYVQRTVPYIPDDHRRDDRRCAIDG